MENMCILQVNSQKNWLLTGFIFFWRMNRLMIIQQQTKLIFNFSNVAKMKTAKEYYIFSRLTVK